MKPPATHRLLNIIAALDHPRQCPIQILTLLDQFFFPHNGELRPFMRVHWPGYESKIDPAIVFLPDFIELRLLIRRN